MMSEICATSRQRSDARRGVLAEAGCRQQDVRILPGELRPRAPRRPRRVGAANCGASACSDPGNAGHLRAAAPPRLAALCPATSTSMSPPIFCAAAIVLSVATFSAALSCSAMTSVLILRQMTFASLRSLATSSFASRHLPAALALRRLDHLERREPRRDVDAERFRLRRPRAASSSPS